MKQIVYKSDPSGSTYDESNKCRICRRLVRKGECVIKFESWSGGIKFHRSCMEDWLEKTPSEGAASAKTMKAAEIETEFVKLRRKLMAEQRKATAPAKTPARKVKA